MRTVIELARDAIAIQDACNLVAVFHGAARAVSELCDQVGWAAAEKHPVCRLWVCKILHLARTNLEASDVFVEAWGECEKLARAGEEVQL